MEQLGQNRETSARGLEFMAHVVSGVVTRFGKVGADVDDMISCFSTDEVVGGRNDCANVTNRVPNGRLAAAVITNELAGAIRLVRLAALPHFAEDDIPDQSKAFGTSRRLYGVRRCRLKSLIMLFRT